MKRYIGHAAGYVLGFHGCDRATAEKVLSSELDLVASANNYDWLGHGIYFWEGNYERAKRWANERMKRRGSTITNPYVIGAIIDLGHCLSLLQTDHLELLTEAHETLKVAADEAGEELPKNTGGKDRFLRRLDCAVIQVLHQKHKEKGYPAFDTVRGLFQEGETVYPRASFRRGNHIQICVRNRDCIKGYFRPLE